MGEEVYERFHNKRLIEKQIFLNLLENKYLETDFDEYFNDNNDRDLLVYYYDKQLCSTENYYAAAKIMYLLSSGRIYNIVYSLNQIYEALMLSKDDEIQNINQILQKLCDLHLIKLVQRDDINYYEIVYDYVAESFVEYAEVNLHQYVKNNLDSYRVNFKNKDYSQGIKQSLQLKKKNKLFERLIFLLVCFIITSNLGYKVIVEGCFNSVFLVLPLYFASYYGYCLYTNIFKLYNGNKKIIIRLLYVGMAICIIWGCLIYKFWLIFAGLGTLLIGIAFFIIHANKKISRVGKKFYYDFGSKVSCTVVVILITGLLFNYLII